MLRSLSLRNFKKHEALDVEFTPGLNLITGPNWAGKTTILYGILFALGGASSVPGTNIQRNGTNSGFHVKLLFAAGGDLYRVDRKKNGAYLFLVTDHGEEMVASGVSPVNEKIEELLGMPMRRFRQLKYAEQKKAHALLTTGAGELHKILDDLKGVTQINDALDRLKDILKSTEGALEVLQPVDLGGYREMLAQAQVRLVKATEGLRIASAAAGNAAGSVENLDKLLTRLRQQAKAAAEAHQALTLLKARLEPLQGRSAELALQAVTQEQFTQMEADLALLKHTVKEARQRAAAVAEAAQAARRYRRALEAATEALAKAQQSEAEAQAALYGTPAVDPEAWKLAHQNVDAAAAITARAQMELQQKQALQKGAVCPTCKRPHEGYDPQALAEEVQEAARVLEAAQQAEKISRAGLESIKRLVEAHQKARERLAECARVVEMAQRPISGIEADLAEAEATASQPAPDVAPMEAQQAKLDAEMTAQEKIHDEWDRVKLQVADLRQKVEQWVAPEEVDEEQIMQVGGELQLARDELSRWKDKVTDYKLDVSSSQQTIDSVKSEIERGEKINAEHEAKQRRYDTAKALQKYLRDNRDRYAAEIWEFFLATASEFIRNCTGGAITSIRRDESGQFRYVENDVEMGLKDSSGAQEAIMGLGVQFALADAAMCPVDTLLVDEPTADMSVEVSMATSAMLAARGRQVIAVSHREMDASMCSNSIVLGA